MAKGKSKEQVEVEKVVGPVPTSVKMHLDRDPNDERVARVRKHESKLKGLDEK